jgi:hypothetical protein
MLSKRYVLFGLCALAPFSVPWAQQAPSEKPVSSPHISLGYVSAFDGYQGFELGELKAWNDSNATVLSRGGWRAYSREASEAAPTSKEDGGKASSEEKLPMAHSHDGGDKK